MNDEQSQRLIDWWFSGTQSEKYQRWFGKNLATDQYVTEKFGNQLSVLQTFLNIDKSYFEDKKYLNLSKKQFLATILCLGTKIKIFY